MLLASIIIFFRELDYLDIPQKVIFIQYMKDSMQMGKDRQDVASEPEGLI